MHALNKAEAQRVINSMVEHSKTEQKINAMIGEALVHKEGLIEELEKELVLEKSRREQMN